MTIQSGNTGTAPGAAPRQGKSRVGLILGCGALFFLGFIGFCVVSTCGLAILGGSITRTPTVAAQAIATTPIVQKSFTPAIVQAVATTPSIRVTATTTSIRAMATVTSASASTSTPLHTALLGSVFLLTPDDSGKPIKSGSGTIITSQGHILTNFHVIGDKDTGKYTNRQGLVYIGINPPGLNANPNILYLAQVIKGDNKLDLALLRIVATRDGGRLPADLKLTPVPVGDSDKVQIGDETTVIGFPDLGDGTVTLTRGSVSGFLDDTEGAGTWIKTDAGINPGNSGGMAINHAGEVVGVPSQVRFDTKVSGQSGRIRPINFAKPFTQLAQRDAQSPVSFTFTPWSSSPTVAPTTLAGAASFAPIVVCDEVKDGKPVNPRTTFPAGTKKVTGYWTFKGMARGQEWGRRWLRDGQVIVDKMNQQWNDEESGWTSLAITDDSAQELDAGTYELHLSLGKTEVQKATFTIQKGGAAVPTALPQTGGSFGKIIVAENVTDAGETVNPTNTFSAGTKTVWVYFTYINMKNGDAWGRKWLRDGAVLLEKNETWDKGATGWQAYSWSNNDGSPLSSGNYEFILYLGSKEVQRAAFTIRK